MPQNVTTIRTRQAGEQIDSLSIPRPCSQSDGFRRALLFTLRIGEPRSSDVSGVLLCIRIVCIVVADLGASRSDRSPVTNKNLAPACASWRSEQGFATPSRCVPQLSVEDLRFGRSAGPSTPAQLVVESVVTYTSREPHNLGRVSSCRRDSEDFESNSQAGSKPRDCRRCRVSNTSSARGFVASDSSWHRSTLSEVFSLALTRRRPLGAEASRGLCAMRKPRFRSTRYAITLPMDTR